MDWYFFRFAAAAPGFLAALRAGFLAVFFLAAIAVFPSVET